MVDKYSTKNLSEPLLFELAESIRNVRWGSVEIIIQDNNITQITEKNIKKPLSVNKY